MGDATEQDYGVVERQLEQPWLGCYPREGDGSRNDRRDIIGDGDNVCEGVCEWFKVVDRYLMTAHKTQGEHTCGRGKEYSKQVVRDSNIAPGLCRDTDDKHEGRQDGVCEADERGLIPHDTINGCVGCDIALRFGQESQAQRVWHSHYPHSGTLNKGGANAQQDTGTMGECCTAIARYVDLVGITYGIPAACVMLQVAKDNDHGTMAYHDIERHIGAKQHIKRGQDLGYEYYGVVKQMSGWQEKARCMRNVLGKLRLTKNICTEGIRAARRRKGYVDSTVRIIYDSGLIFVATALDVSVEVVVRHSAAHMIVPSLWADWADSDWDAPYSEAPAFDYATGKALNLIYGKSEGQLWAIYRALISRLHSERHDTDVVWEGPITAEVIVWGRTLDGAGPTINLTVALFGRTRPGNLCMEALRWTANQIMMHDIIDYDNDIISAEDHNAVGMLLVAGLSSYEEIHLRLHRDGERLNCLCAECIIVKKCYVGTVMIQVLHPKWGLWLRKLQNTADRLVSLCQIACTVLLPGEYANCGRFSCGVAALHWQLYDSWKSGKVEDMTRYYDAYSDIIELVHDGTEGWHIVVEALYRLAMSEGVCVMG